jgi:hypothetical protein
MLRVEPRQFCNGSPVPLRTARGRHGHVLDLPVSLITPCLQSALNGDWIAVEPLFLRPLVYCVYRASKRQELPITN